MMCTRRFTRNQRLDVGERGHRVGELEREFDEMDLGEMVEHAYEHAHTRHDRWNHTRLAYDDALHHQLTVDVVSDCR